MLQITREKLPNVTSNVISLDSGISRSRFGGLLEIRDQYIRSQSISSNSTVSAATFRTDETFTLPC